MDEALYPGTFGNGIKKKQIKEKGLFEKNNSPLFILRSFLFTFPLEDQATPRE